MFFYDLFQPVQENARIYFFSINVRFYAVFTLYANCRRKNEYNQKNKTGLRLGNLNSLIFNKSHDIIIQYLVSYEK